MSVTPQSALPDQEGGLRAARPIFWGKVWWWFHFLILVKIARLRFIAVLVVIGLVIVKWDTLVAYYERWTRPDHGALGGAGDIEFFCPMHPSVVRDTNREKCPICFMPLSKRKKGDVLDEALPPGIVNRVQLSPYRVVLAGIQTWKVTHVPLVKEISTVGFVEFNERELKHVAARVKGRIDKLYVAETGRMVQAGDELAALYSQELLVTVLNLLEAHRQKNDDFARINRDRLLWGIADDQIDEIIKSGKASTELKIRSPIHGHVLKKYVKEGQYVDEGSPLYDVVDLSTVWIQAQVFEDDMPFLPFTHEPALKGRLPSGKDTPLVLVTTRTGETLEGRLTFVFPHVDLDTRTVVVRMEVDNPGHKLRPGTSATAKLKVAPRRLQSLLKLIDDDLARHTASEITGQALLTPGGSPFLAGFEALVRAAGRLSVLQQGLVLAVRDDAVIDTGSMKIVYREVIPGEFEGVRVELGPRMTGPEDVIYYPVLGGLSEGDAVVTSGAFLVDAETRLNPAVGSIYFGGSSGSKSAQPGSKVKPSTPEDEDAKIKAAIAKLPQRDRAMAEAQKYCPIQKGSRLASMGVPPKLLVLGQPVFLCCSGCEKEALAHPQQTLDKVAQFKKGKGP